MLSQGAFAEKIGMERNNVVRLSRPGVHKVLRDRFTRMAEGLAVTPAALLEKIGDDESRPQPSGLNMSSLNTGRDLLHFHGIDAARTTNREAVTRDTINSPRGGADSFWVTVDGDCMEPNFPHGSIIQFSYAKADSEGTVSGKPYFIRLVDDEITFKTIVIPDENFRDEVILRPLNRKYPDRVIERSQIAMVARAITVHLPIP